MQLSDGSVGVPNDAAIAVTFSKLVDPAAARFFITSSAGLPVLGKYSGSGTTIFFTPSCLTSRVLSDNNPVSKRTLADNAKAIRVGSTGYSVTASPSHLRSITPKL